MSVKRKKVIFTAEIEFDPESGEYVAYCPELDVATGGASLEEAKEMLADAMLLAAEYLVEEQALTDDQKPFLPYAQRIYGLSENAVKEIIDAHLQLR